MTRIAIHPTTLDLKAFKPGLGLQQAGYVVVKDATDLADKGKGFIDELARRILGHNKKAPRSRLLAANKIWTDVVVKALRNIPLDPDDEPEDKPERVKKAKNQGVGRGNHNSRIPSFTLTGVNPTIKMPTQAEVLCLEFNKLYASGIREVNITRVKELVKDMKLPTQQDPMRIFRYYFWLCVRAGVFAVEGEAKVDVVVRQNADRHGFDPSQSVTAEVMTGN